MSDQITTIEQLDTIYGDPVPTSILKELDHITDDYATLINTSPFVVIATSGPEGLDCSPRGDPAGFVRIVDEKTLMLPDRRGNNRVDSLRNIVRDPRIALLFLIPGIGTTMRVNGRAKLTTDLALRESFAMGDKVPACVIVITVESIYTQCQKAIVRSKLWDPAEHVSKDAVPTVGQMMQNLSGDFDAKAYDAEYPERMKRTIYSSMTTLPIIDLTAGDAAVQLRKACRDVGFFALLLSDDLDDRRQELIALAAGFFALPDGVKERVSMDRGGPAWRGWFPLGAELTSGIPDLKEGFYFGEELAPDPRPMHGANLWPDRPAGLAQAVSNWMDEMQSLGQQVLSFMAEGLGLSTDLFATTLTGRPTPLFRIFRYPPQPNGDESNWGVREHSDYGLLTLLATDGTPGLEISVNGDWITAPADPKLLICNLGDMLDRLTGGRYRSTRHRVRNHAGQDRYTMPFFLDPGWDASIAPLDLNDGWVVPQDANDRWDRVNVHDLGGTYGEWVTAKVTKVFPALATDVGL